MATLGIVVFPLLYLCASVSSSIHSVIPMFDLRGLYPPKVTNDVASLGCRRVNRGAVLIKTHPMMTMLWCTKQCWEQKTRVALIQESHCLCSDEPYKSTEDRPSECTTPCRGSKVQMCGGKGVATAMKTGHVQLNKTELNSRYNKAQRVAQFMHWQRTDVMKRFNGTCFKWKPTKKLYFTSVRMTLKICMVHCFYNKFVYALLSVGMVCQCTSLSPPEERDAGERLKQMEGAVCDKRCMGNTDDICGGKAYVNSIYLTGHYRSDDAKLKGYYIAMAPLKQNWNKFLVENRQILEALSKGYAFELRSPEEQELTETNGGSDDVSEESEGSQMTAVVTVVSLAVSVLVVLVLCFVLNRVTNKSKNPNYAKLAAEEAKKKKKEKKKIKKMGKRGRKSSGEEISRMKKNTENIEQPP